MKITPSHVLLVLVLALAGCGWANSPIYSLGPYTNAPSPDALFTRVSQLLTAQGYQPASVDQSRGLIVVPASYVHRGNASQFTIQCYREGWILVTASGGYVRRRNDGFKMPKALRDEYQALVVSLRTGLGPPAGGEQ